MEQPRRVYDLIKGPQDLHMTIGLGSYGTVKLARCRDTKEIVALKIVHNRNAIQEIEMQKRLVHPNIIKLLDYYYDKDKNVTYMVLEYADNGTLFEKLRETKMEKPLIKRIFRDTCNAIGFMHQNGIMHRDIKPQNILLTKKWEVKLCDFGFAAEHMNPRRTLCGTYEYMSPEMILQEPYTHKNDIWGLGILLFELVEGQAPFRGQTMEEVLASMKKQICFSERFSKQEISLVKEILRVNPRNRPEVCQILNHPFFAEVEARSSGKHTKSSTTSIGEEDSFSNHQNGKIKLIDVKLIKTESNLIDSKRLERSMVAQRMPGNLGQQGYTVRERQQFSHPSNPTTLISMQQNPSSSVNIPNSLRDTSHKISLKNYAKTHHNNSNGY